MIWDPVKEINLIKIFILNNQLIKSFIHAPAMGARLALMLLLGSPRSESHQACHKVCRLARCRCQVLIVPPPPPTSPAAPAIPPPQGPLSRPTAAAAAPTGQSWLAS